MVNKATSTTEGGISSADIRDLCGDIADWKVSAIADLSPTVTDIELAVAWADGRDEFRRQRSLEGNSAQIFDILTADEDADEER